MRSAELQELYKPFELLGALMMGISYVQETSRGDQDVGSKWTTGIS